MPRPGLSPALQRRATRLGELLPVTQLHPAVLARAARSRPTEPWCVALSGGADSVALLLLLWAHFPTRRGRLIALHFNHRLRGRAARADAAFCARLCAGLGVRLQLGEWAEARRGASEAEARAARLNFFAQAMRSARARWLWLAHQQDDVAETLLMRLARGSGAAGLAAPRPVQVVGAQVRLRPLLGLRKAALLAALRTVGASWREDATNAGPAFFRNRVRLQVVPAWQEAAGRDAVAGAALTRERLDEDDEALEAWLNELRPIDRRGRLEVAKLAGRPVALWRRALHRWLLRVAPQTELSRQGFEQLLHALRRGKNTRFSLGRHGFAVLRDGWLAQARAIR